MLKLVSINIQGADGKLHRDRVRDFVTRENPDILCLQELRETKATDYMKEYRLHGTFAPMGDLSSRGESGVIVGIGLFSKFPLSETQTHYYAYQGNTPPWGSVVNRSLITATIGKESERYVIGTTHFTVTPDGQPDERQRKDLAAFLKTLSSYESIIFCGDFNAPRGLETFETIARRYRDHIPEHYDTSLDPDLHKTKGKVRYMVDGLFSTDDYRTEGVRLQFGISDHAALVAMIGKV